MAKVKKMAFGGMGKMMAAASPAARPVAVVKPAPAKPLPPGSIGMPGGLGGKTTYNTGPMPVGSTLGGKPGVAAVPAGLGNIASRLTGGPAPAPATGATSGLARSLLGGGAAPSQPVTAVNNIGRPGFKMAPATLQSRMASGGKVSSASKRADGIAQRGKTRA